jgi:TP901 family phage tail tape measure protein
MRVSTPWPLIFLLHPSIYSNWLKVSSTSITFGLFSTIPTTKNPKHKKVSMSDTDLAFRATLDGSGFASGAQAINGHLNDMGIRTNSATASLGPLGTILGSMASPLSLVALGAGAVGAGLSAAVNVAASFESAMSRVGSVSGASAADQQRMSDAAREAGASTVFSASQAADAMYFLASSGMTVDQQIASLGQTLNLASAGGLDLAKSAEVMTSTLAQFSLGAEQSGRVANVFAAASAATNTDVTQLGDAMKNAGPMAAAVGMTVEEAAASIGVFSNSGVKGAEAGTALKSILGSLLGPTKTAAGALAEMGLSVDDVNPSMHSYGEIMATLNEKHMTAAQSVDIFGKEMASSGLIAVNGAKSYEDITQKITGTNKAAEMSAQMTNNMNGAWAEFTSAAEEAGISLGSVLLPVITDTIKFMTEGVEVATAFGKKMYEAADATAKLLGQGGEAVASGGQGLSGWLNSFSGLGYDEMASPEMQARIAGMAQQSATTYVDEWGNTFDTSDYKSFLVDKSKEAGKEAGEEGGKKAGETFTKEMASAMEAGWDEVDGVLRNFAAESNAAYGDYTNKYGQKIQGQGSSRQYAEDIVGKTTISGAEFVMDTGNTLTLPDGSTKYFDFKDSASFWNSVYGYINDWAKTTMSEEQKAELRDDVQALVRLKANVEIELENKWEQVDSQRSWMKYIDENKELAKSAGDEIIYALYNAEQEAIKRNDPTLSESLANVMKALAAPGSVSADIFNTSLADIIDSGLISASWSEKLSAIGLVAAKAAGQTIKTALLGELQGLEAPTLAELIKNPALEKSIGDQGLFLENTFLPGLKNDMGQMNNLYNTGFGENQDIAKNYVEGIEKLLGNHRDWFSGWQQDLLTMYQNQKIGLDDLLDIWNQMEGAAQKTDKLKDQTVGYDNLKKAIEGCGDCAVSEFGQWQEAQEGLFQDSYIGQGGEAYVEWKQNQNARITETQAAMDQMGGAVLGQRYDMPETQMKIGADMSPAEADKAAFEATITAANPELKVSAITQAAMDEVNRLVSYIITVNPVMSVQVQVSAYAGEIRAIVESEVRAALA